MRRLRGTALDPFAYTRDRAVDRRLIAEYERAVEEILAALSPDNHAAAVELAALPGAVRGFGHVKERHVEHAKRREAELLGKLRGEGNPAPKGDGGVGKARERVVMAG